jgi:hypothetical protein
MKAAGYPVRPEYDGRKMHCGATIVRVGLVACSTFRLGDDDDGDDDDVIIICDCFPSARCIGDVVRIELGADLPCDELPLGDCPHGEYVCEQACAVSPSDLEEEFLYEPWILCAETPAARPGDPCGECLPTRAVFNPDGTVTNVHLACVASQCQPTAGPVIERWLEPCSPDLDAALGTGYSGYVNGFCPRGYCLFHDDPSAACVKQGCTAACDGDRECPVDAFCDDSIASYSPGGSLGICRPGARGRSFADFLVCP